jgi:putative ABC transport system permease protein
VITSARVGKIVGDVRASRGRTVLVTLSIAAGVTAVGMVAGARSLMLRTLDSTRAQGAFPSATVLADSIPSRLLPAVRRVTGVEDAELRRAVGARVLVAGASRDLTLFALADFDRLRMARIQRGEGAWPPPTGTMLVERSSLGPLGAHIGETVRLQLPSVGRREVRGLPRSAGSATTGRRTSSCSASREIAAQPSALPPGPRGCSNGTAWT